MNTKTKFITHAAIIAAIYVIPNLVMTINLTGGIIQCRVAEAFTILPIFTPAAVPGLFVGCLLSNLLMGAALYDVIFGSLATLLGAIGTYALRDNPYLSVISPITANTIIIPFILKYTYGFGESIPFIMLMIFIGEVISCGVLGIILYKAMQKSENTWYSLFKY
ncbi:MAG: QueT transporter family protein [Lachnospiraceae bacterium]|nr:QueT transporter family protein [Lachnospiraceae bacterium]